jgi:hypothetical protein
MEKHVTVGNDDDPLGQCAPASKPRPAQGSLVIG